MATGTVAYAATKEIAVPTALAVSNDARATVAYVGADLVLHILALTAETSLTRRSNWADQRLAWQLTPCWCLPLGLGSTCA